VTFEQRFRRARPVILGLYVVLVAGGFLYFNMRLTVEWVAIILFVAALLSGRARLFVRDWGVFIAVLLAWQLASPLATRFDFPWHLQELINADKLMFGGTVPTVWLQQHLYHPGHLEPWDVFAAIMYMLHFLAPLLAGFALWMTNRELFGKFALTFVLVAVAGFATYILYPAVPPWMAATSLVVKHGHYVPPWGWVHGRWAYDAARGHIYLPGVRNLFNDIASRWYNPYHGTIFFPFLHLHYDNVAAIPSEHAMYPMLFFLFLRRQFGRPAYLVLLYIAGLLFSITYLGQHYVIDAVIGFVYAFAGYALVMHIAPAVTARWRAYRAADAARTVGVPALPRSPLEEA
jgi:hypothetical protein